MTCGAIGETCGEPGTVLVLPLALAACFGSDGDRPSLMEGSQAGGPQPFPDNFRTDTLALMRAYLNNPVGVREASMADPVLREIGGRQFYIAACTSRRARPMAATRRCASGHRLRQRAGPTASSIAPASSAPVRFTHPFQNWKRWRGSAKPAFIGGARTEAAGAAGSHFGEL